MTESWKSSLKDKIKVEKRNKNCSLPKKRKLVNDNVLIIKRSRKNLKSRFKMVWFITDQLGLEDVVVGLLLLASLVFRCISVIVYCNGGTKS